MRLPLAKLQSEDTRIHLCQEYVRMKLILFTDFINIH